MTAPVTLRSGRREFGYDLGVIGLTLLLAIALGILCNRLRRDPLPWIYTTKQDRLQQSVNRLAPPPANAPAIPAPAMIDLARFHELTENGTPILDARPELFYRAGHVPGAQSLSRASFEQDYARLKPKLEPLRRETLAVYCAGDECEDSRLVAFALQKLGYAKVLIFQGGWDEWRQAGLPEESSK